ncbi:hypothetical protein GGR56DRAFT_614064 [Xylariaceae sp. FL0804]|nr:hypothetical protein GGR56DRAFT_614064 [Xylariaceae sp. FL0804]
MRLLSVTLVFFALPARPPPCAQPRKRHRLAVPVFTSADHATVGPKRRLARSREDRRDLRLWRGQRPPPAAPDLPPTLLVHYEAQRGPLVGPCVAGGNSIKCSLCTLGVSYAPLWLLGHGQADVGWSCRCGTWDED